LLTAHRKKMLKEMLWLISEADGKYSTRFRSAEVVRLARDQPNSEARIQHEHVFPRAEVADRLLRERQALLRAPEELEKALDQTIRPSAVLRAVSLFDGPIFKIDDGRRA
jgi:hypothetical protein